MKYLCMVVYDESKLDSLSPTELDALIKESVVHDNDLRRRGHLIAAHALQPVSSATTVQKHNGKPLITDGPFAETREQVGGFILIEANDLDEAIHIAANIPPIRLGAIEIRPVRQMPLINPSEQTTAGAPHKVVSHDDWLTARIDLLAKEKQLTRARDAVNAERLNLPWERVEKNYTFETPTGTQTLSELFEGRSQLLVYHFMWRADLNDACVGCSFLSDHIDGANQRLAHHDVTLCVISRGPLDTLQSFRQKMGWKFNWVSSAGSDFNYDYHVSFTPEEIASGSVYYNYRKTQASVQDLSGFSAFYKDTDGTIYHTYSSYGRGNEEVLGTYIYDRD
jgi:predicted dithiol-disulfide oxidoreductase (DUF899 family)